MNARQLIEADSAINAEMDLLWELEDWNIPDELHAMIKDGRAELSSKAAREKQSYLGMWFPNLATRHEYYYELSWYNPENPKSWPYGNGKGSGMNYDLDKVFDDSGERDNECLEDYGHKSNDVSTHGHAIEAWYKSKEMDDEWPQEMRDDLYDDDED